MPFSGGHTEIQKRLDKISEQRTYESKMRAIQALEHSVHPNAGNP